MTQPVSQEKRQSLERTAWIYLLAGPVLYSVYFVLGYLIAEAGCNTALRTNTLFGINAVAAIIVGLTGLTTLLLVYTGIGAYRAWRRYQNGDATDHEVHRPFVWRSGLLLGLLFTLMTVVTGISVFFLQPCAWI